MLPPTDRAPILAAVVPVSVHADARGLLNGSARVVDWDGTAHAAQVRTLGAVRLPTGLDASASAALLTLAGAGVILLGSPVPACPVPILPSLPVSVFEQEVASVCARRVAWAPRVAAHSVTAVLSTNRPDRAAAVLHAMAAQSHSLDVVLVGHGVDPDLVPAPPSLPVTRVHVPADTPFGAALTVGCLAATGSLVLKLDDDDFYGPDHVLDLLIAREHSGAAVVGKALQYVFLEPIGTSSRTGSLSRTTTAECFGDWVAGGTIGIDAALGNSIGWFDPLPRHVDRNLLDKALAAGSGIWRTHGLGYLYVRHDDGHTWQTDSSRYLVGSVEQRRGPWPHEQFGTAHLAPGAVRTPALTGSRS